MKKIIHHIPRLKKMKLKFLKTGQEAKLEAIETVFSYKACECCHSKVFENICGKCGAQGQSIENLW